MPRKVKTVDTNDIKKNKKTLLNTIVKNINSKDEHIILKLPLTKNHIDKIIHTDELESDNSSEVPVPYERNCCFLNEEFNTISNVEKNSENVVSSEEVADNNHNKCCFWCCHKIECKVYGMPINYDSINDTYTIYGSFCSLQCANAYNFSSHNGSDKVWEVNSMIQMMSKRLGFKNFIRPAPSRYLLKMFDGYMTIEEFRNTHKNNESTHILNLPPMISIPSGYEVVNTSYLKNSGK